MTIPRLLLRVLTAIQLTRLTLAFGAVSDLWFVVVVSRAGHAQRLAGVDAGVLPGPRLVDGIVPAGVAEVASGALPVLTLPVSAALLAALVAALGLFAFGAALNDLLDARHDTAFSPERPIPAGKIKSGQAIVVTIGSLLTAMVAATAFGQAGLLLAALTAAALLFYNAAGKHIPAIGLVTVGAAHAIHMMIPNEALAFTLPVWLVASHTMAVAAAVHHLEEKRPPVTRRSAAAALLGYAVVSAAILGLGFARGGLLPVSMTPLGLVWPSIAVIGFAAVAQRKAGRVPGRIAAEKLRRYGAMWHSLYGAAWLLALGLEAAAFAFGLFALAGFVAMTMIKEVNGLTGQPVEFRG